MWMLAKGNISALRTHGYGAYEELTKELQRSSLFTTYGSRIAHLARGSRGVALGGRLTWYPNAASSGSLEANCAKHGAACKRCRVVNASIRKQAQGRSALTEQTGSKAPKCYVRGEDVAGWLVSKGFAQSEEEASNVLRDEVTVVQERDVWKDLTEHSGTWSPNDLVA